MAYLHRAFDFSVIGGRSIQGCFANIPQEIGCIRNRAKGKAVGHNVTKAPAAAILPRRFCALPCGVFALGAAGGDFALGAAGPVYGISFV